MGRVLLRLKAELSKRTEEEVLTSIADANVQEEDVMNAKLCFVSEGACFLTGVSLNIDGGEHLGFTAGLDQPANRRGSIQRTAAK